MSIKSPPRFGTVEEACRMVGGDKPIDPSTYYRGVKLGIYPPTFRASPNSARVDLDRLAAVLRARAAAAADPSETQ